MAAEFIGEQAEIQSVLVRLVVGLVTSYFS